MMPPLTEAECQILLRLARQRLEEVIGFRPPQPEVEIPSALERDCGAFVTLREDSVLRGCVGRIENKAPLYRTVCECAISAALEDSRFARVLAKELERLQIEISVLSELHPIQPEQIEVGRHGLLVCQGPCRGLLLPQVAVQWKWSSIRFLEEACAKAGLLRDAWQHGACVYAFTAQVFAEHEPGEPAVTSPGRITATKWHQ